jgi:putative transposase
MVVLKYSTRTGAQFTSEAFTDVLKETGIDISMDGKGRWIDNVFVERLWRSVKYEEVYLKAYETVAEARTGIGTYFQFYNSERRHRSMNRQTPDQVYMDNVEWPEAA